MKRKAPAGHENASLENVEGNLQYKEPIDKALFKMEQLQEKCQVKLNRLCLAVWQGEEQCGWLPCADFFTSRRAN